MKLKDRLKYLVSVFFCLCCFTSVFAQEGDYFITQKNDTVSCTLEETGFSGKKFKYMTPKMAVAKTIHLDTIAEYSTGGIIYTRRTLPGDSSSSTFLMWRERGKINLFEFFLRSTGNFYNQTYYAAKGDGPLFEVKTNQMFGSHKDRLQRLTDLLADAPKLLQKFRETDDYSFEAISSLIQHYNNLFAAPKGYIITLKNDTIKCTMEEQMAGSKSKYNFSYKTAKSAGFMALNLDTVNEYIYKQAVYTKRIIPGETEAKLMLWSIRGKLNLFEYDGPNGKYLYAAKGTEPIVEIKAKSRMSDADKQTFVALITDYPELLEQFNNTPDHSTKSLRLNVSVYNKQKK